jgi:YegS/Rv2252/BmrU family lipid kinase
MPAVKIIANPASGGGNGAKMIPQVERLLGESGLEFDLVLTQHCGHGIRLAKEAALVGYQIIVAAGGDGTVNEVINGIMEAREEVDNAAALGVLCIGRGNDFAYGAGVPVELDAACQVLISGYRRRIDIGLVMGGLVPQGRYFGNCVGVGFDAVGTIEVAKLPRMGGFLSFFIAVLKTIFLYHQGPVAKIVYNGQSLIQPSLMISIMNGRRLGGGFMMAPEAQLDDGYFDLCIAHQVSRIQILRLLPHFLRGTQSSQEAIQTGRAAQVSISAVQGSLPAQTDGEIICIDGDHLDIELLSRQIDVVCLPDGGIP